MVLLANQIEHEIQRSEYDYAPNAGGPENNLRDLHPTLVIRRPP